MGFIEPGEISRGDYVSDKGPKVLPHLPVLGLASERRGGRMGSPSFYRAAQRNKNVVFVVSVLTFGLVFHLHLLENTWMNDLNNDNVEQILAMNRDQPYEDRPASVPRGAIEITADKVRVAQINALIESNYVESIFHMKLAEFKSPQDVRNPPGNEWLVLGAAVIGLKGDFPFKVRTSVTSGAYC